MKEGKKNTVLLTIIGIATLLVAVIGATFAYFSANITGNDQANTVTVNTGKGGTSSFQGGEFLHEDNIYPKAEPWIVKPVTITYSNKDGSGVYTYKLELAYSSTFNASTGTLAYSFTPGNCSTAGVATQEACTSGTWNTSGAGTLATAVNNQALPAGTGRTILLGSNATITYPTAGNVNHYYTLQIFYPDNGAEQNTGTEPRPTFDGRILYSQVNS